MRETSKILNIFRNFRLNIKMHHKSQFSCHISCLEDRNTLFNKSYSKIRMLNHGFYFTFIGLGATNIPGNKKIDNETNEDDDRKRERDVSQHIALAEIAIKHGDLKKAEMILQNAVLLSQAKPTVGMTCVYDMLATLAYREGNILKAKDILVNLIKYLIKTGTSSHHESVIKFQLQLARILSKIGSTKEAEELFKKCLASQQLKHKAEAHDEETEMMWITTLFWYGKHLSNNKKYLEAKECFEKAFTLSARNKSVQNSQVMVILFNLSEMSFLRGEKDEALKYLLTSVIIGRLDSNPDLATYYNRIGLIYLSKGLLNEAKLWCEEGIEKGKRARNHSAQREGESCIRKIKEFINLQR